MISWGAGDKQVLRGGGHLSGRLVGHSAGAVVERCGSGGETEIMESHVVQESGVIMKSYVVKITRVIIDRYVVKVSSAIMYSHFV